MIKQYDKSLKNSVSEDTGVNHENSSRLEKVQIDWEWSRQEDLTGRCVLIWTGKRGKVIRGKEKATVRH